MSLRMVSADISPAPAARGHRLLARHFSLPTGCNLASLTEALLIGRRFRSPNALSLTAPDASATSPTGCRDQLAKEKPASPLCRAKSENFDHRWPRQYAMPEALFDLPDWANRPNTFVHSVDGPSSAAAAAAANARKSMGTVEVQEKSVVYRELRDSFSRLQMVPGMTKPSAVAASRLDDGEKGSASEDRSESSSAATKAKNVKERPFSLKMLKRKHSSCRSTPSSAINMKPQQPHHRSPNMPIPPHPAEDHHAPAAANNGRPSVAAEGDVGAGDAFSSAFSCLVFMMNAVQDHIAGLRGALCGTGTQHEGEQVLQESLLWLFQRVFSSTPTLMLLLMTLLVDFTVQSTARHVAAAAMPVHTPSCLQPTSMTGAAIAANSSFEISTISARSRFADKLTILPCVESDLDSQTRRMLVAPVVAELEPDNYACYDRTDLNYQHHISMDPTNPLLLLNYAHFLYLVRHDYPRAHGSFRRAIEADPQDSDAMGGFAQFLWVARGDVGAADEAYRAAVAADPSNAFHAGCYAYFLWNSCPLLHADQEEGCRIT